MDGSKKSIQIHPFVIVILFLTRTHTLDIDILSLQQTFILAYSIHIKIPNNVVPTQLACC